MTGPRGVALQGEFLFVLNKGAHCLWACWWFRWHQSCTLLALLWCHPLWRLWPLVLSQSFSDLLHLFLFQHHRGAAWSPCCPGLRIGHEYAYFNTASSFGWRKVWLDNTATAHRFYRPPLRLVHLSQSLFWDSGCQQRGISLPTWPCGSDERSVCPCDRARRLRLYMSNRCGLQHRLSYNVMAWTQNYRVLEHRQTLSAEDVQAAILNIWKYPIKTMNTWTKVS